MKGSKLVFSKSATTFHTYIEENNLCQGPNLYAVFSQYFYGIKVTGNQPTSIILSIQSSFKWLSRALNDHHKASNDHNTPLIGVIVTLSLDRALSV